MFMMGYLVDISSNNNYGKQYIKRGRWKMLVMMKVVRHLHLDLNYKHYKHNSGLKTVQRANVCKVLDAFFIPLVIFL